MEAIDRNKLNGAVRLLREQRHENQRIRAARMLKDLEVEHAANPRGLMQIGDAWLRGEERAEALRVFMLAGEAYAAQRFYKYAGAMFRNVVELEPSHAEARERLAQMLEAEGMPAEATRVRKRAVRKRTREVASAQRTQARARRATSAVAAFAMGAMVVLGPLSLIESGWIQVEGERTIRVEIQQDQVHRVQRWMRGS